MATGLTSFQWFFWGYSLAFSHTAGKFIGDLSNIGFRNVLAQPSVGSHKIPDLLFAVYQGMFASITVALGIGAVAERGRLAPAMVFSFVWSTVIYDAIACWTWNPSGWVYKLGGLDFAGGTPVHISSGAAALAYSLMLGKRRGHGTHELNYRPHNVTHIVIGTVFLWVGCNYATKIKFMLGIDDALDIFAVHCIGGFAGNLMTGLFAADYIVWLPCLLL
jgi:Amt family ammonium transporter